MASQARIYIFTGKGGVGKTTLAEAMTLHLHQQGKKVFYSDFDQAQNRETLKKLNIPTLDLNIEDSALEYIARKLNSKTIASWIMKTPFFSSLFKMVPGLANMILLGHMIDLLESDPDLTIVLDSPSSGHALTMLESPFNFKDMFGSGLIVEDIMRMERFIAGDNNFSISILSLPSLMAVTEAVELQKSIQSLGFKDTNVIANDIYSLSQEIIENKDELPEFMLTKLQLEQEVSATLKETKKLELPHYFNNNSSEVVKEISLKLGEIL
ncbi:ArsA-related P-loop ATPase [Halobacteriovorax sp. GB3]|uniref:ArsA-related P-loop ATPase n=1 Tax=Halobacteriovorax sp. GB3 TaxID=2719615 RepID=UPI0023612060|nr:ArsA-related P-loop ATPase [Halobacteriovorax sp. GB3]MDD0854191.1 ArsA-related P-loop ATPase [Halobacteriovorax sp. GB3]